MPAVSRIGDVAAGASAEGGVGPRPGPRSPTVGGGDGRRAGEVRELRVPEPGTGGGRGRPALRAAQLIRLGFPRPLAEAVADHVDWHEIVALVHRGCGPRLALNIVL